MPSRGGFASILLLTVGLLQVGNGAAGEAYCFNAGVAKGWDCAQSTDADIPIDRVYHTLKVTLSRGQDDSSLDQILPIKRIGEVKLPSGERVVFLGRFRDSMKAFRVVERCRSVHVDECGRYDMNVVKIGLEDNSAGGESGEQVAGIDVQNRSVNDLVATNGEPVDLSQDVVEQALDASVGSLFPQGLIKLPDSVKFAFWVDLKQGNLHVIQHDKGVFNTAETISVSIGKNGYGKMRQGDKKTPVGVYRLLAHLTDAQLDDFYGVGAYTMNYPNALDRIEGRNGSGIWLHGLPKGKDHRPLQDSDGCVVLSNVMLDSIGHYVNPQNTPIVLDNDLQWVEASQIAKQRGELEQSIEAWRSAWSSIDNDRYLGFYADEFTNGEKNLKEWKQYKTRIHKNKKFIKVRISDLSLLAYPGAENTVMARFFQRYESSNFKARAWKEQLWRKEDSGKWKIVFEKG